MIARRVRRRGGRAPGRGAAECGGRARRFRARRRSRRRIWVGDRRDRLGRRGERLCELVRFSAEAELMGRFVDALCETRPRRDRGDQAPLAVGRRPPARCRPGADRSRLRRGRRCRDLGSRRRALRRHVGRPPRRARGDRARRCSRRASSRPRSICGRQRRRAPTLCCCCCVTSTTRRRRTCLPMAARLGLDTLVEAHDADELDRGIALGRPCSASTHATSRPSRSTARAQLELVASDPRRPDRDRRERASTRARRARQPSSRAPTRSSSARR